MVETENLKMKITVKKYPVVIPGFRFSGVACGLKPSGKRDLSLLVSDVPATAVAAFTTNRVKAAPVIIGEERLRAGRLQAIVVNSGNANASTAQPGLRLARDTCALVGRELAIDAQLVLPSSTGGDRRTARLAENADRHSHRGRGAVATRFLERDSRHHDDRRLSQSRDPAGDTERTGSDHRRHG